MLAKKSAPTAHLFFKFLSTFYTKLKSMCKGVPVKIVTSLASNFLTLFDY